MSPGWRNWRLTLAPGWMTGTLVLWPPLLPLDLLLHWCPPVRHLLKLGSWAPGILQIVYPLISCEVRGRVLMPLLGLVVAPGGSGGKNIPLHSSPPEPWRGDILLWHIPQFWLHCRCPKKGIVNPIGFSLRKVREVNILRSSETYMRTHYVTWVILTEYEEWPRGH